VPREQGQGAARENAALGAYLDLDRLLIWPLCEESNLANRVRSPMPGRRDRENRSDTDPIGRLDRRGAGPRRSTQVGKSARRPQRDSNPRFQNENLAAWAI
jgi:hypothetical protein